MKKIFQIISHFEMGGAEQIAINIAKSTNNEFQYHIIEVAKGKSKFTEAMLTECRNDHIIYHRSPFASKKTAIVLFPFWFLFLYLKHKPAIIHTHTEIPDLSIFLFQGIIPYRLKVKYVRTVHNTELWNSWKKIGKKVEPFFIKEKSNITISSATQDKYSEIYGESTPIILNGIEIKEQRKFEHLKKNKLNILFAGRFEDQKGIKELIEVVNQLVSDERFHFHIVGSGTMQKEIEENLEGDNYTLYTPIYNLSTYLNSFDYLFMPSNFEGLGLMSIEASLSHTPPIINLCIGLEETLPHDWPLKVQNNSVEDYIRIFNEKIPQINYEEISKKAYQYASLKFSITTMQRKYEEFYRKRL